MRLERKHEREIENMHIQTAKRSARGSIQKLLIMSATGYS